MPRNDRRNAYRYAPARDNIRLGWRQGHLFQTSSARLRNLSLSGALVQLDEGAAAPAGLGVWICLVDQAASQWVPAEVVEICPELPGPPSMLRLKFLDPFPYECFKVAVWDHGSTAAKLPSAVADPTPPPCKDEATARATNEVATDEREHTPASSQINAQTAASSSCDQPVVAALASPHPPTLLEAYRSQMAFFRKVAPLTWLVVLLISLSISILLGLLVRGHMINLQRLGIVLGLSERY